MSPFSIFALLYMTAFFVELTEDWEDPIFTFALLGVIAIMVIARITRIKFLVFLVLETAYFLFFFHFPDVANHVNVIIYLNIAMIVAMIYSFARNRDFATDDDYFEMISPVLRASLILVYVLAGFHKLNRDFLDPDVSCAGSMLGDVVSTMRAHIFGVPVALVLAAGFLFIVWKVIGGARFFARGSWLSTLLLILCVGGVLSGALILIMEPRLDTPEDLELWVVIVTITLIGTILWELIGGLLLTVPKFQAAILPVALTMHAVLAMIGFVDFSALAFSLLFTFIPPDYYRILDRHSNLRFSKLLVHRAHVYFVINVIGGLLYGIHIHIYPSLDITFDVRGIFFNAAVLVLIWPILSAIVSRARRPVWGGVPVLDRRTPKFMFVFLVFLFLYGMTSYFGLRTAGNFSMYSNLRTEGNSSNHFLLGSNPIKVWGYQEDVVRFIALDDDVDNVIHRHYRRPLRGKKLPVVEFRRWIYEWTRAGQTIPLTFKYRGVPHETEDITKDPVWRTEERTWEMVLMDFRVIQPGGPNRPNRCRW
jgi:hypothetical protein